MTDCTVAAPNFHDGHEVRKAMAVLVALWAVMSTVFLIEYWPQLAEWQKAGNDDLLRLVEIRDWLGGQSWSDLTQYRIGPEDGLSMHWSRLGDLGPAAIIAVTEPHLGRDLAERLALALYPVMLMLGFALLAVDCARRLGGPAALLPGVFVTITALPLITHLLPGRIDHHGLQIVLMLVMLRAVIGRPDTSSAVMAGMAMALSFAVGIETVPYIFTICAVLFLLWVRHGDGLQPVLKMFGLASCSTMAVLFVAFRPQDWSAAYCDAFSPAVVSAGMMIGGIGLCLALVSSRLLTFQRRAAALVTISGLCCAVLAFSYPDCLAGPFGAIDPFLKEIWLRNVNEARSLGSLLLAFPGGAVFTAGLPVVASAVGLWALYRADLERPVWLPALAVLLMALLITVTQVRAGSFATAFAIPVIAAAIACARRRADTPLAATVGLWVAGCGATYLLTAVALGQVTKTPDTDRACRVGSAYSGLAELPPGRVLGSMDVGPLVLAFTPHKVVGAPYHRNNAGNRDNFQFFLGTPEEGLAIARQRAVDYVMVCPTSPESVTVADRAKAGLLAQLLSGAVPSWLEPIPSGPGAALRLYRVKR